ncbi:hypothetical protein NDA10_005586 [Ustilago hordei]|nr:hypothetical protein NDA10_005586 [Ustilago hordei]UTT89373.1 hypothetical protein NDA17_002139 [Ustilago hordei]
MPPRRECSSSSADSNKSAQPRPSSLSLLVPRTASVRQLVSRWQTQPDPWPSSSLPPVVRSPLPPHHAHLATATNQTNGTLAPLDSTPKYGVPSPLSLDIKQLRSTPSPRSPQSADPFSDRNEAPLKHQAPSLDSNQRPHLIPLGRVQPVQTIPWPASRSSDVGQSITAATATDAPSAPSAPSIEAAHPLRQHLEPPPPPKAPLGKTSSSAHIFDLDAKVSLGTGNYLPSSFRPHIPDQPASIPEPSSSHLSASPQPSKQTWSAEDPSSIPLLPASPVSSGMVTDEIAQNAVSSNLDPGTLPVSADEVFKRDAAPIHLPALEEYLNDPIIFGEPIFTDSLLVCTQQEKQLFGLQDGFDEQFRPTEPSAKPQVPSPSSSRYQMSKPKHTSTLAQLEVAGGQINCPALLYTSSIQSKLPSRKESPIRRRPRGDGQPKDPAAAQSSPSKKSKKAQSSDIDPLLAGKVVSNRKPGRMDEQDQDDDDDATAVDAKQQLAMQTDDAVQAEKVASRISARLTESHNGSRVSSKLSTRAKPITRKEMFPPLMLLKENNLDELKSNAIGPRKPPGGISAVGWLGIIFDMVIGVEGSTFAAGILRLETLRDLFQIMTIQLNFQRYFDSSHPTTTASKFFKFLLQTLPAILAFDLVSVFGYAVIFFLIWILITALALWTFWRTTKAHNPNKTLEAFDSQGWIYKSSSRGTRFANTCLVFLLGLLYLPLSKLAIDALVWSSDFWPVANPYKRGIDDPVPGSLLGDPDIWRAPLDFCYTTTMRKDAFNYAYVIIPLALLTIIFYTLWYPFKLMMTIKEMLPHVSPFNELGRKRSQEEMHIYYHRLLNRDKSPFNFLYNSYHRKWGYYKPLYILLFKFTNLIIIGVLAKDNCLFRSFPTRTMLVVQQSTLILVMASLLGVHLFIKPFVDKIGNRSEMVSRIGYVLTATIGLLVALNVQGSTVYNTTILYIVQAFTYGGNIYFSLIGMSFVAHQVKRWQNRVDYTIDLFSPLLDITKHIKRRVWQETLSILILCGPQYHMPLEQVIAFSVSDQNSWPSYLIDFQGSVAERHIENLKIVKQIGIEAYRREVHFCRTQEGMYREKLIRTIQRDFTGPDAYWRPQEPPFPSGVMSFFGKAFLVPFPPTLVLRYDEGNIQSVSLTCVKELEAYIEQNSDPQVRNKKMVRQALRALEGQKIFCPYVENVQVGDASSGMAFLDKMLGRISRRPRSLPRFGILQAAKEQSEYILATPVSFVEGTLKIERSNEFDWAGYNFDRGFQVSIVYEEGKMKESTGALTSIRQQVIVSASRAFGLTEDFEMNPALSRFLQDNERLLVERAPMVEKLLRKYRRNFEREARWKHRILPYSFLTDVFDNDGLSPLGLGMALVETGCARSMRNLPILYEGCVTLMYERLAAINRTPVHRFWWLLFDELWRLNCKDYSLLRKYRRSFSPQYPTCIAYRPMTRAELEKFLAERGLWKKNGSTGGPFNRGLLNRIYFYLNEIVFARHHDGRLLNRGRVWSDPQHQPGRWQGEISDAQNPDNPFLDPVDSSLRRAATIKVGLGHDATQATRRDFSTVDDQPCSPHLFPGTLRSSSHHESGTKRGNREERWWGMTTNPSLTPSQYTGGGTAYSNDSVIVRTAYRWEQRMDGYRTDTSWHRFRVRALQWLSLHPVEVKFEREKLYLYLKLVDEGDGKKRYELFKS